MSQIMCLHSFSLLYEVITTPFLRKWKHLLLYLDWRELVYFALVSC